ncbi:MAG: carboxypeptidase-like regulatory domain-containing protein [Jatrophihabitans sp.]
MRAVSESRQLDVDPGSTTAIVVDVVNSGAVIDGITAHVIGLADEFVTTRPALLPLFPDASGQLVVSLAVPSTHPAGRHPLTVEVVSHGAQLPSQFLDFEMDVAARPTLRLAATPRVIRARRSARFVLELTNAGNVALDVGLRAVDAERSTTTVFTPPTLRIEAGAVAPVLLYVRGPRMFTGAEIERTVTVQADAARAGSNLLGTGVPEEVPGNRETTIRLRQRPLISRGLLTALILASIIGLWAGVFLLGLTKVFSGDPMTKSAPASFFAAAAADGSGAGQGKSGAGAGAAGAGAGAAGSGAAPAGALPKSGQLPPGVGGEVTGAVVATSDRQPVGRILVQAWRKGRDGLQPVSSAATQADGTYTLAGLFPTSYFLKFSSAGYRTVWYPAAPTQTGAQSVNAVAQGSTTGVNATITGLPASISGTIDPGDTTVPVTTTVVARPLLSTSGVAPKSTTTVTNNGKYSLSGLAAPGSYELTFTTPGYQASTLVDSLGGGDKRLEPTLTLGASTGTISGVVSDNGVPLGGATIRTTLAGEPLSVTTPTTGQVGAFTLGNLPTPATYVISFSAPGHGSHTEIVDLRAGQSHTGLNVDIAGGTGSVTGTLTDENGNGLGGATVTVGGTKSATPPTTTTLTAAPGEGNFAVNGLTAPGAYTLTFTLDGYAPASVPVRLTSNAAPPTIDVHLTHQLGAITGIVTQGPGGSPYIGATVTATDGTKVWTGTSTAAGGSVPDGGYLISGLQPGSYSVTATAPGLSQQSGLITVVAGKQASLDLRVGG